MVPYRKSLGEVWPVTVRGAYDRDEPRCAGLWEAEIQRQTKVTLDATL